MFVHMFTKSSFHVTSLVWNWTNQRALGGSEQNNVMQTIVAQLALTVLDLRANSWYTVTSLWHHSNEGHTSRTSCTQVGQVENNRDIMTWTDPLNIPHSVQIHFLILLRCVLLTTVVFSTTTSTKTMFNLWGGFRVFYTGEGLYTEYEMSFTGLDLYTTYVVIFHSFIHVNESSHKKIPADPKFMQESLYFY